MAIGTDANPITFTSNTGTCVGSWGYIRFTDVFIDEAATRLVWSPNSESDLAGYQVYWDSDSGYPYAYSVDVGNVNIPSLFQAT